jgi:hypothetical protein
VPPATDTPPGQNCQLKPHAAKLGEGRLSRLLAVIRQRINGHKYKELMQTPEGAAIQLAKMAATVTKI